MRSLSPIETPPVVTMRSARSNATDSLVFRSSRSSVAIPQSIVLNPFSDSETNQMEVSATQRFEKKWELLFRLLKFLTYQAHQSCLVTVTDIAKLELPFAWVLQFISSGQKSYLRLLKDLHLNCSHCSQ